LVAFGMVHPWGGCYGKVSTVVAVPGPCFQGAAHRERYDDGVNLIIGDRAKSWR